MHVDLGAPGMDAASGRLLIFVESAKDAEAGAKDGKDGKVTEVDTDILDPSKVTVIGKEVGLRAPGLGG